LRASPAIGIAIEAVPSHIRIAIITLKPVKAPKPIPRARQALFIPQLTTSKVTAVAIPPIIILLFLGSRILDILYKSLEGVNKRLNLTKRLLLYFIPLT
jgi:hypothetical protein